MRYRHVYMGILTTLTFFALFFTSPDAGFIQELPFGGGFVAMIVLLLKATLYIALLHVSRKGLFDYMDLGKYAEKALETPLSASIALLAIILAMFPLAFLIYVAQVV